MLQRLRLQKQSVFCLDVVKGKVNRSVPLHYLIVVLFRVCFCVSQSDQFDGVWLFCFSSVVFSLLISLDLVISTSVSD